LLTEANQTLKDWLDGESLQPTALYLKCKDEAALQGPKVLKVELFKILMLRSYELEALHGTSIMGNVFSSSCTLALQQVGYDVEGTCVDMGGGSNDLFYQLLTSSFRPTGKCSQTAYYARRLHTRRDSFKILHNTGCLFQEFIVDTYAQIEQNRLRWNRISIKISLPPSCMVLCYRISDNVLFSLPPSSEVLVVCRAYTMTAW
jgi:hypothetical protein